MSVRLLHLHNETNASCPDLRGQGYRACFHTHSSARGPRKKIYHGHLDGKGPRRGEHAVVKVFRDTPGTETMCDVEIAKHKLALRLAKKFNKMVPNEEYHIHFTLPLKSTVERLGMGVFFTRHKARHIDTKEWVLIEENLIMQGDYQVFIKKTGERLGSDPTSLDAFLHFTYHESGGLFLMCGFQGVEGKKGYLLTTPCIHSQDKSYGTPTDKGPGAMRNVFRLHRCNNLCYSFARPDLNHLSLEDEGEGEGEGGSIEKDIENRQIQEDGEKGAEEDGKPEDDVTSLGVTNVNGNSNSNADGETGKHKERKILRLLPSFRHKRDKKKDKSDEAVHGSNVQVVGAIRKRPSI